jgi:hypothetical protein
VSSCAWANIADNNSANKLPTCVRIMDAPPPFGLHASAAPTAPDRIHR